MPIGVVQTQQGLLQGVFKQNYTVFRGVPYAAAPVGAQRWRAPQPPPSWQGVHHAAVFGPRFMQKPPPMPLYTKEFYADEDFQPPVSEDALCLNVWTPAERGDEKLPVAVWIHGGGFAGGFGSEIEFDGAAYCRRGVILVSINYRVGVFGFLAHPWLAARDPDGRCGNYGILDQLAALRWVRENIGAFGGDADNVTIFGQSAGAMSVQTLVSSPLSKGLVHKAVMQSGGGYGNQLVNRGGVEAAYQTGEDFVRFAGVSSVEELLAMPADKLNDLSNGYGMDCRQRGLNGLPFAPHADGWVLPAEWDAVLDAGGHLDIPYMLGCTKNDFGVTDEQYNSGDKGWLHRATVDFSLLNERLGRAPAYVYHFLRDLPGDDAGAFHSAELWYMFGTMHRCWRPWQPQDWALQEQMLAHWSSFMKTGDPNAPGQPQWRPCTAAEQYVQEFA